MSRHNRLRAISIALSAGAAMASLAAVSCIKQKDSLVIVGMTSEVDIPGPLMVHITVGPVTQTFEIAGGLSMTTPTQRGVYLDHDTTGSQVVSATTQGGTPCVAYGPMLPQTTVIIGSAGDVKTTSLTLVHTGTCGRSGTGGGPGSGGSPGAGGNGGTGSGGTGAGGSNLGGNSAGGSTGAGGNSPNGPPSLAPATCHEFVHSATADCSLGSNDVSVYTVAVAPNGALVASGGGDARAKIWRFDGHTLTAEGHVIPGSGFAVTAFSPDGSMLAIGWATGIDIYNTSNLAVRLRTLTTSGQVYDLAFTPDSQQIMSIDSGTLYAHSVTASAPLHSMPIPELTWLSAVSPAATNPPVVAVATQAGTVRVFTHSASGFASAGPTLTADTTGAGNKTLTVKFSPDGKLLAASAFDDTGTIHIWNYPLISATPTQPDIDVATPTASDDVNMIDFHPSGKYLGVGAGFFQSMSIYNTAAPRAIVSSYTNPSWDLISISFSPSGAALIGGEDSCGLILVCAD